MTTHFAMSALPRLLIPALLVASGVAGGQVPRAETAREILRSVAMTLPTEPVLLVGDLTARDRRGRTQLTRKIDMTLDLAAGRSVAAYTLFDSFGGELERFEIIREDEGTVSYLHRDLRTGSATKVDDATSRIPGLDFSWADLSFDFIWWPDAERLADESKLNRPCYVLKIQSPTEDGAYAHVLLWVDQATHGLLQADGQDSRGELVRRMQVKNMIRLNEVWIPGDVEVTTYPDRTKTRLRIRDYGETDSVQGTTP